MIHTDTGSGGASRLSAMDQPGRRCLPEALAQLRRAGVGSVRFEYAGQSDYRRVKPVTFREASGRVVREGIAQTTRADVEVFFREWLELRFPEWSAAEGSREEFEWCVESDELTHRHQWRVIAYDEVTVMGLADPRE